MSKIFSAYLSDETAMQLEVLRTNQKRTSSNLIGWLISEAYQKFLSNNSATSNNNSAEQNPSAPAARHVPTVEEVLAMRKPEASDACWEFWGDWPEEQRRALIGPLGLTRSVLDERFGLSPDDEPYGDD